MQGADMQEVWFIKLFALFGKIVAGVLGAILALVLSGDIDKDGRIKINPSLIIKFSSAVAMSVGIFTGVPLLNVVAKVESAVLPLSIKVSVTS